MKKRNKNFHDSKNEVVIQKNIFFLHDDDATNKVAFV